MAQTIKLKRSGTSGATPTTSQLELGEVAINTYDGKMYIKKDVSGTESIVEIGGLSSVALGGLSDVTISSVAADQLLQYNGSEWVNVSIAEASAIMKEYQFTATSGQSTFSGSDDNSETLSYTAGAIQVFLNGIFLDSAVDYTATNGTSIVLSETVDANDYLQVVAFKKKIGDGNVSVDTFTGDDSTTAFTLSLDPGDENNTRVFIDGVYQSKSNYSVSGTTLTFSTAPPTGTAVEVEIGNRVVTLDTLSDLDLPDDVKLRLGTGQDLQIYHDGSHSYINEQGTGNLYLNTTNGGGVFLTSAGENLALFNSNGAANLYYDGSAKLATTNDGVTVTGDVEADEFIGDVRGAVLFKAQAGETLAKGEVVYISGISGNTTVVSKADADDASKMPAFGLVAAAASSGNPVDIYTNGILSDIDTSAYSEGDELFVSTTAGALTATAPTGESAALQKIGKVTRSNATSGSIFIVGAGRSNAVPNLDDGDIFIGNASNQAVSASLNTKIESYLDGGTSTPTFASLTFDNYTLDSNKIATNQASGYNGDIFLDAANVVVLDAANAGVVQLKNNGSHFGTFFVSSDSLNIQSNISDADIVFKGSDGGTGITALTLDMSAAGEATFNAGATFGSGIDVTGVITTDGMTTSADINFGDNDKAIFGTGSDLQIYHDSGTGDSIIAESGAGHLFIRGANTFLQNVDGSNTYLKGVAGGAVDIRYGGAVKLATTSTGIDVTGGIAATDDSTFTAASGDIYVTASTPAGAARSGFRVDETANNGFEMAHDNADNAFFISRRSGSSTVVDALKIDRSTGDFSLFEDTGTTPKFFWDASAELLEVSSTGNGYAFRPSSTSSDYALMHVQAQDGTALAAIRLDGSSGLRFHTNGTNNTAEKMRIDSSGNVGIGTTSPSSMLHLQDASDPIEIRLEPQGQANYPKLVGASASGTNDTYFAVDFVTRGEALRIDGETGNLVFNGSANITSNTSDGSDNAQIIIAGGGSASSADSRGASIHLAGNENGNGGLLQLRGGSGSVGGIRLYSAGSERMRITPAGNVGIGTTSPAFTNGGGLEIENSTAATLRVQQTSAHAGELYMNANGMHLYDLSSGLLAFGTSNTERMRLNGSGDWMVGNTVANVASNYSTQAGCGWVESDHHFEIATTNNRSALEVSKNNANDGEIITFRKQGNVVGRLGTFGTDLYIGQNNSGLRFEYAGLDAIVPFDADSVAINDNVITLGHANARFKDLHLSGTSYTNQVELAEISTSNSDTAVDVFVYDTRKDSDGGAWRKRTQNTSWYNETLNTSTRGSRREFPCVAVIVTDNDATDPRVRIYDGDDPNMPLWMEFFGNQTADLISGGAGVIGPVTALNGIVCVGATTQSSSGAGGIKIIDFISDRASQRTNKGTGSQVGYYKGNLEQRNDALSYGEEFGTAGLIVGIIVNDIAMTVLPNAPIDADTGLPVPTIAVATNGGVSVIKDDGNVVDITHTNYTISYQVKFLPSGGIAYTTDTSSNQRWLHVDHTLPSSDDTKGIGYEGASDDEMYHTVDQSTYTGQSMKFSLDKLNAGFIVTNEGDITVGSSQYGIGLIARNSSSPSEGLIAEITSDYNTGWMHGDTKLAALSDIDTTNVTSPELITNGTTFSNTTGWSGNSATVSVSGGELVVTGTGTFAQNQSANFTAITGLTPGDQLIVSFDITEFTAVQSSAGIIVGGGTIRKNNNIAYWYPNSIGTHTTVIDVTGTSFTLYLHAGTGVGVITKFDNISVRKLHEVDRSYNNNDLQVFGTVTKTAVATGADLVAYSGWSSSNYLEQPYNSDLDFGTGDFSVIGWYTGSADGRVLLERLGADQDGTTNSATDLTDRLYIYTAAGKIYLQVGTDNFATPVPSDGTYWRQLAVVRRSGTIYVYQNGTQYLSRANTQNVGDTDHILRIGTGIPYRVSPATGNMALWRISATAPTEEQIKKMYNDEKYLFQDNAQAALYGSSDEVTALAYDDDTELLHVGTSAGRSVFSGLRRVDNTTDAVGAAISASNGFIVED